VEGLVNGDIEAMSWESVNGWTPMGGALLGTKRTLPQGKFEACAKQIRDNNIQVTTYTRAVDVSCYVDTAYHGDLSYKEQLGNVYMGM
jgi:hypothetical protein